MALLPDDQLEQRLQERPARRVTQADVDNAIASVQYHEIPGTTITLCVIRLVNGYTVTGQSACASPENFDRDIGQTYAYRDAVGKIWPLLAFLICEQQANHKQTHTLTP